jgi:putative ABC transport system substrate-binding protein
MNRRDSVLALLAMAAAIGPLSVRAQQSTRRPYRIALVPDFDPAWGDWGKSNLKILTDTLRKSGRIEGRDYVFYRSGVYYGPDTKPAVDRALQAKPDLLFVMNLGYAVEAHRRTKTIPIVLWVSGFPVAAGVANSLAKPGTNVTGMTIYGGGEYFGKLLDLLHQAKPSVKRVGFLMSYVPPFHPRAESDVINRGISDAARALGVDLRIFEIAKPEQVDDALAWVGAQGIEALVLTSDPSLIARRDEVMKFAVAERLLTIGDGPGWRGAKPESSLVYWAPFHTLMRQVAPLVEQILWEGAKPGDLPIQLPTKYKFGVNLKTAKASGLSIPQSLLIQADEVIE